MSVAKLSVELLVVFRDLFLAWPSWVALFRNRFKAFSDTEHSNCSPDDGFVVNKESCAQKGAARLVIP